MHLLHLLLTGLTVTLLLLSQPASAASPLPFLDEAQIKLKWALGSRWGPRAPLPTFCDRFRSSCISVALDGKASGDHAVIFDCKRGKWGTYVTGCRLGDADLTNAALSKLSAGIPSTSIVDGGTVTVTETSTVSETILVPTTTTNSVQETASVTEFTTTTSTATFSTTTTRITRIATVPVTATVTSTVTAVSVGKDTYEVTDFLLDVPPGVVAGRRRAIAKLDPSEFCAAYSSACGRQCTQVGSQPEIQVCSAKSTVAPIRYSLACVCKNGRVQTQNALADVGNDIHVTILTTFATQTTTALVTATTVVPTLITTTSTDTLTSTLTIPVVLATTVSRTATVGTTTTTATLATTTATSTTVIVVAPTGVLSIVDKVSNNRTGFVANSDSSGRGRYRRVSSLASALDWVVIRDAATGFLRFAQLDNLGALGGEAGQNQPRWESSYPTAYAPLVMTPLEAAPAAAHGVGPFQGNPFQSWIVSSLRPSASVPGVAELIPGWINPSGAIVRGGAWLKTSGEDYLFAVYDFASFAKTYSGYRPSELRFFITARSATA